MSSQLGTMKDCPQTGDSFLSEDQFIMNCDEDFIVVTVGLYKFFMAHGKDGLDAKQLYDHLVFTSRVQGSKSVKANLQYIKNGLGWGNAKIKKAKAFLSAAGLIEYVKTKGEAGLFDGQNILIRTRWDEESLANWLEKKRAREAEEDIPGDNIPVDNSDYSTGSEIEPVEHIASQNETTPDIQRVNYRTGGFTDPLVSSDNYKGVITKNPSAKPHEEEKPLPVENSEENPPSASSPPTAGSEIKNLKEMKDALIAMVKKRDPESRFVFMKEETALIKTAFKFYGPEWLIEQFHEYLKSKSVFQVNRFHSADLPRFLQRTMDRTKPKTTDKPERKDRSCPCCGRLFPIQSTLSACGHCGLDLKDFDNPDEVASHIDWWESYRLGRSSD